VFGGIGILHIAISFVFDRDETGTHEVGGLDAETDCLLFSPIDRDILLSCFLDRISQ
jgi:hypothetical protein